MKDVRIVPPKRRSPDKPLVYAPPPRGASGRPLKSQFDSINMGGAELRAAQPKTTRIPK